MEFVRSLILNAVIALAAILWSHSASAGDLHDAVAAGDIAAAEQLLIGGVDVNAQNDALLTPLVIAALSGREDLVDLLILRGADPQGRDGNGLSALHASAHAGYPALVDKFLGLGLDPNDQANRFGISPLHAAAERGHVAIAAMLLEHGADLSLTTATGHTPVFMAVLNTEADMVQLLRNNGAECEHIRLKKYRDYCATAGD